MCFGDVETRLPCTVTAVAVGMLPLACKQRLFPLFTASTQIRRSNTISLVTNSHLMDEIARLLETLEDRGFVQLDWEDL